MLTAEAIAERRKGIGGADAAAIVAGGEAWHKLWLIKTARVETEDLSANWAVQLGIETEALNLRWYAMKYAPVSRMGEVVICPDQPILRCTLDGFDAAKPAVIQAKHVNGFSKLDEVVTRYTPQVTHEMIVTRVPHGFLSVIIGSNEPVVVEVEYDAFFADDYIDRCCQFWEYVYEDKEPPGGPPPLAAPIPVDHMRVVDMQGDNEWSNFAADWLEYGGAAKKFDSAAKGLKGKVEADVRLATGHGVKVSRDGRGLRIGAI